MLINIFLLVLNKLDIGLVLLLHSVCFKIVSGGYDKEEKAARAYDLAALKYWGPTTHINFPASLLLVILSWCVQKRSTICSVVSVSVIS